jgi:catechol 2,3-dioxygenase-like lactoylglutathione lyase family enzyme
MGIRRMDHIGIVVEDLAAMTAFFTELGLEVEGRASISGDWAERVTGLPGLRTEVVMLRMPDGTGRIELSRFSSPAAVGADRPKDEPHGLGYRSVMFEVDDIDDTVARLLGRGELIGEIAQYEQAYRLCYLRGPEGIIVALAEAVQGPG